MSICGGAPDNMVPFSRQASPWGSKMSYQGLYQVPKQSQSRSLLWEDGQTDSGIDKETVADFSDIGEFLQDLDGLGGAATQKSPDAREEDILDIPDEGSRIRNLEAAAEDDDCPNKQQGTNETAWARKILGRIRTRGGAFDAGTEEKRTVRDER
jgi:hypothetical protein